MRIETRHVALLTVILFSASALSTTTRPSGLTASQGTFDTHILVGWDAVPDATASYEIMRSTEPDLESGQPVCGEVASDTCRTFDTTLEDNNVSPGTKYYYWVRACATTDGCGEYGSVASGFAGDLKDES